MTAMRTRGLSRRPVIMGTLLSETKGATAMPPTDVSSSLRAPALLLASPARTLPRVYALLPHVVKAWLNIGGAL